MIANASIRKQARMVGGGLLAILTLLAMVGLAGAVGALIQSGDQSRQLERLHNRLMPLTLAIREMQLDIVQVQQYLSDVSATRGENGLDDGFDKAAIFRDRLTKVAQDAKSHALTLDLPKVAERIDGVMKSFPPYYDVGVRMAHAYMDKGTQAGNNMMEDFDQQAENLTQQLEALVAAGATVMAEERAAAEAQADAARSRAVLLTVALVVVGATGATLAVMMARHIDRAAGVLTQARDVMHQAARGDLNARMVHVGRADEIGQLMVSMNRVLDLTETFAKEIGAAMAAAERKEYFRYIPEEGLRGDFLRFVRSINAILASMEARDARTVEFEGSVKSMVDDVAQSTQGIRATANMMARRSEATGGRSLEVGEAAKATTERAEAVSQATRQLVSSINEIATQADQSRSVAQQAVTQITATSTRMDGLAQAVSQIGQVVGLINTIAGQTNLLALNATIEAARAGEAGKGFAVVAGEVKKLANQTADATSTITGQVETVQAAARDAVEAIADAVHIIERIDGVAAAIAGAVVQQEASTQEISRNIEAVVQEASHVSTSVSQLSQSSAQSCAGTVRVIWGARKLAGVVDGMHAQVTDYIHSVS